MSEDKRKDVLMPAAVESALTELASTKSKNPTITSERFRDTFLPLLAGTDPRIAENKEKYNIDLWIRYVGDVYTSCDIVEDGVVVLTVPPVLRRNPTLKGVEVTRIANRAANRAKQLPTLGQGVIRSELVNRVQHIPADRESLVAWNKILNYYGYATIPLEQIDLHDETEAVDDTPDFGGEYEDL